MGFLFSKPKMPAAAPQTPVPSPTDPEGIEARRRAAREASERAGASSTLLSDNLGTLGDAAGVQTPPKRLLGE